jgi:hypothetical protein
MALGQRPNDEAMDGIGSPELMRSQTSIRSVQVPHRTSSWTSNVLCTEEWCADSLNPGSKRRIHWQPLSYLNLTAASSAAAAATARLRANSAASTSSFPGPSLVDRSDEPEPPRSALKVAVTEVRRAVGS